MRNLNFVSTLQNNDFVNQNYYNRCKMHLKGIGTQNLRYQNFLLMAGFSNTCP